MLQPASSATDFFAVWDLQFLRDGTRIAAVGSQQVKVWETANLASGQEIITLEDANQALSMVQNPCAGRMMGKYWPPGMMMGQ